MGSGVEIEPSAESDRRLLFGLAKSAFAGEPGWSDRRVLDSLASDVVFVAREPGGLAGYVALRREEPGVVVVEQILVAPGHEQRGIGHRLLAHAEGYAIAERARTLRIVVEEDNRPARNFYLRSGFVQVGKEVLELVLPRRE